MLDFLYNCTYYKDINISGEKDKTRTADKMLT